MKKNGFTLIELIGTIVILSVILMLIVPEVTKRVKDASKDADEKTIENIELAAKNYASDNKDKTCVEISTLKSEGYLDDDAKIPKDKNGQDIVSVTIEKNKNIYTATTTNKKC